MRLIRVLQLFLLFIVISSRASFADEAFNLHLVNRLTFGPTPELLQHVEQIGAERFIEQQLHPEKIPLPDDLALQLKQLAAITPSPKELISEFREQRKVAELAPQQRHPLQRLATEITHTEHLVRAVASPRQLEEVLVDFWFNHFNVYGQKGLVRPFLASYERDAIRPFVLGHFRDLLSATAHHPAMLFYLDNWQSTAAGFQPMRQKGPTGLNENYARELMELHTLGVDGGYTQADVTQLARMLTGWTFYPGERKTGEFVFDAARHDGGDKQWLGLAVPEQGVQEGEKALDVLAAHPATAQRVAYLLAQYFVADEPPSSLVKQLANTFTASKGDLRVVMAALFASKEFRNPRYFGKKFKTPYRYVVSSVRASGLPLSNTRPLSGALRQLGQPLYGCLTPDGYKNTAAAWLNPDGLSTRIQFAGVLASGKLPLDAPLIDTLKATDRASMPVAEPANDRTLNALQLVATLGGGIKPETLNKIDASPIPLRATLLLGSPDFMYH